MRDDKPKVKGVNIMGKKQRNRVTGQKRTITCPFQTSLRADEAHGKSIPPLNGSLNTVFPRSIRKPAEDSAGPVLPRLDELTG